MKWNFFIRDLCKTCYAVNNESISNEVVLNCTGRSVSFPLMKDMKLGDIYIVNIVESHAHASYFFVELGFNFFV